MATFDRVRFLTTHNSYSGGARGTMPDQLASRIRYLELDFHDNGWEDVKDYRVGHLKAGMEVALGSGNPTTLLLKDWLGAVARWSVDHPGHGPITIVLDSKDDLTDNEAGGDLEDFNRILIAACGDRLFTRDDYDRRGGGWPDVAELRDRLLCVISGNGSARASYRWAFGHAPAIAANDEGDVVALYTTPIGDVNCWTGTLDVAGGTVRWTRKSNYGLDNLGLSEPAVAVTDGGWIVSVHRFSRPQMPDRLESWVGRLQDDEGNDGRIRWFSAEIIGSGVAPTLQVNGDEVVEIHMRSDGQGRQRVRGTLNRQTRKVEWQKARPTQAEPFSRDAALSAGHIVRCAVGPEGWIGCRLDAGPLLPVRFRQIAFVERQRGEDPAVMRDALFFAADAKHKPAIADARAQGLVARAWGFENGDQTAPWVENMPATDTPSEAWYQAYLQDGDVSV